MTESQEHEMALAIAWHEKKYTTKQAQRSAEWQGINFTNVCAKFERLEKSHMKALK